MWILALLLSIFQLTGDITLSLSLSLSLSLPTIDAETSCTTHSASNGNPSEELKTTESSTSLHSCFPSSYPHSTKRYANVDPIFYPWLLSSWESIHNLSLYRQLSLKLLFRFKPQWDNKKEYLTTYLHRPRTTRQNSINFPNAKEITITAI